MLEIAVFNTKNSTTNSSVDFQNFPITFCAVIAKLLFPTNLFKSVEIKLFYHETCGVAVFS